jgi:hypothetical protein
MCSVAEQQHARAVQPRAAHTLACEQHTKLVVSGCYSIPHRACDTLSCAHPAVAALIIHVHSVLRSTGHCQGCSGATSAAGSWQPHLLGLALMTPPAAQWLVPSHQARPQTFCAAAPHSQQGPAGLQQQSSIEGAHQTGHQSNVCGRPVLYMQCYEEPVERMGRWCMPDREAQPGSVSMVVLWCCCVSARVAARVMSPAKPPVLRLNVPE